MKTNYPKTLAVAVGGLSFVAFFAMFASLTGARAQSMITDADRGVAAAQTYMVFCDDMTASIFKPKTRSMIQAWANSRPQVAQARGRMFMEINELVANGTMPDAKTAWATWCALMKPDVEAIAAR